MNPNTVQTQDQKRAKPVPLTSPAFGRMLRTVTPHRRLVAAGIGVSIVYALLHSVSIFAALPILRVLLDEEGLHGWCDRAVAGQRIGAELIVRQPSETDSEAGGLIVQSIDPTAGAYAQGLRPGDMITTLNDQTPDPRQWLRRVAALPAGRAFTFRAASSATPYEITAPKLPLKYRAGYRAVSLIPRDAGGNARMTTLRYVLGALVVIVIAANICRFCGEFLVRLGVLRAMMDLRRQLYAKVLKLPMSRFTRDSGDMVTRFVQDIQEIQRGLMSLFGKTVREPFKAVFILFWALALDWRITATMIVVAPFTLLLFWRTGSSIKKANKKLLRGYGSMMTALTGTLASIGVVKAYTNEHAERKRLWRVDRKMFRHQIRIITLEAAISPIIEILAVVMVSGGTVWLGSRVINRDIDVAVFGSLVVALALLFDPLRKLADVYTRIMRSGAGAERLFEILDAEDETQRTAGDRVITTLESSVEFRDVTFTYEGAEIPALRDINLTVKRGETVALVGRNGSGKTTLVNLICRFHDPQVGSVRLDGLDIREANLRSLRKNIGIVSQDTVVFPISLADNIAYGTRNGSREGVVIAAKRAYADEFIRQTPDGYDTVPGDMGKTLSGGQKQRIAIARAILRDAPILIFDEATSQIDTESEQKIQSAVKEFAKGRTTFIIAHRLSTIRFADRIILLDAGRLIDTGTHEELIARCPLYHGLCETQIVA